MCIAIIGGLDRLRREYEERCKELGLNAKVFSQEVPGLRKRIINLDGIVIFTDCVSHNAMRDAQEAGKSAHIPVVKSHSSSVSSLTRCLQELRNYWAER